jgi:hypothetical protein
MRLIERRPIRIRQEKKLKKHGRTCEWERRMKRVLRGRRILQRKKI